MLTKEFFYVNKQNYYTTYSLDSKTSDFLLRSFMFSARENIFKHQTCVSFKNSYYQPAHLCSNSSGLAGPVSARPLFVGHAISCTVFFSFQPFLLCLPVLNRIIKSTAFIDAIIINTQGFCDQQTL